MVVYEGMQCNLHGRKTKIEAQNWKCQRNAQWRRSQKLRRNRGSKKKALENKQIEPEQSEFYRIPSHTKSLTDEQVEDVVNLIEKMEEDEDVLNVFHNMDMN